VLVLELFLIMIYKILVYDWNHDMLGIWKFKPVWRGLDMVCHMLPTKAHEFMDYKKNP
jgi:hypothetical protein